MSSRLAGGALRRAARCAGDLDGDLDMVSFLRELVEFLELTQDDVNQIPWQDRLFCRSFD